MYLLVGLGNPGSDYAGNRHNIGFMAVDGIHRHYSFQPFRTKFHGEVADGSIAGDKVFILKPTTYMNESGRSVAELVRFYKIETGNVIVLHDELDLSPGKIRVKKGGGLAGHNGLKSIADHIGLDFYRVRIGIGHPGEKSRVTGHVLNDFSQSDQQWLDPLLGGMTTHIAKLIEGDGAGFVSEVTLYVTSLN
ncbi:MAG TPA: aminoacyl-tRNA hydrolase [Rhodospirillales bacterium]|jgi:PTH1 family peptidyl-tRNA hydrolase|nr:aminoacyl-tRNA hydrolase [Rhodospirillales bacterium]HIL75670.1 aminoacyl-tRNA hydrolase [Rhodospirillales bacterium]